MIRTKLKKSKESGTTLSRVNTGPTSSLEETDEKGHHLDEMAQMNVPEDNLEGMKLLVFAESNPRKEPHFHLHKERIDMEIKIKNIDSLTILHSTTGNCTWNELKEEHKKILDWLNKLAIDADMLNKEAIRQEWNRNNMNNRVKKEDL